MTDQFVNYMKKHICLICIDLLLILKINCLKEILLELWRKKLIFHYMAMEAMLNKRNSEIVHMSLQSLKFEMVWEEGALFAADGKHHQSRLT